MKGKHWARCALLGCDVLGGKRDVNPAAVPRLSLVPAYLKMRTDSPLQSHNSSSGCVQKGEGNSSPVF